MQLRGMYQVCPKRGSLHHTWYNGETMQPGGMCQQSLHGRSLFHSRRNGSSNAIVMYVPIKPEERNEFVLRMSPCGCKYRHIFLCSMCSTNAFVLGLIGASFEVHCLTSLLAPCVKQTLSFRAASTQLPSAMRHVPTTFLVEMTTIPFRVVNANQERNTVEHAA